MTRILSPSQIAAYAKCPQAWYLRYVEGLRAPTSPYASLGIWFHAILEDVVLGLIGGIEAQDAVQAAREAGLPEREAIAVANAAKRHIDAFVSEFLPSLHPAAVEEWCEGTLGGYPVRCRLDYRDEGLEPDEYECGENDWGGYVLDWKLSSKTIPAPEWHWEVAIQVALSGVQTGGVCIFDRSGKRIGPATIWIAESHRNAAVEDAIHQIGRWIEAGNAPPLGAWAERYGQCACVYCDYVSVCQFGAPWRTTAARLAAKKEGK